MADLAAPGADRSPELLALRGELARLADWASEQLDVDYRDRQYIAEHLTDALAALANGDPPPPRPF